VPLFLEKGWGLISGDNSSPLLQLGAEGEEKGGELREEAE
jgi:hypothetical protein